MEAIQSFIILLNMCIGLATMCKYRLITMFLILSLSLYSGLEGISIGVQDDQADPWRSLVDVPVYKLCTAFGMGLALFKFLPDRPFVAPIAYLLAYIAASPVGVSIGTRIDATTEGKFADWILVITGGLAFGVFICDKKDKKLGKPDYLRVFGLGLLGVGVMAVPMFWV
ncbi:hypothetical protein MKW94_012793 [Papaver nudicaule]|uniref:Uncharacterized protein n=1 Tax=Papaver nudicaule TaxID=74823 RepID=A0AA41S7H8_PAPNU|nr:hypothetical protein [Papaver nudicaule]